MSFASHAAIERFDPPPGLRHGHIQSMLGAWSLRGRFIHFAARDFVKESAAILIETADGTRLLARQNMPRTALGGVAVVMHGWEGSADSSYMLSVSQRLLGAGIATYRLNFRDHGGTFALNEGLFHSCRLAEVVDAVRSIGERHPGVPLYLVGFSLGGNFALRVAAQADRAGIALRKVVAVCPVLSPVRTMQALEQGLWVYRHYFLRRWRKSLLTKAQHFPGRYDFGDLRRFPTLTATTDHFVRTYTEFGSLEEYLNGYAIVGDVLAGLSVDSLLIATADDPVIPVEDTEHLAPSDALRLLELPRGGHCGLLQDYGLRSWIDASIIDLIEA
jgi:predicted alpha/beta-fold hydrolase